ncbi:hypothetical protein [Cytobacillus purgationiresistens]|uniref:Membrane protein n=1 Tax=Cytobacillus purgationiresistens TaxID=863449 RepID=A0ABU0AD81_9BACI|nr:hypothetical protein [Cytobacillus purgationiresistens]MDQ0268686.1 putative membrane protein [Cytobacillus purgationiresistens]
MQSIKHFSFSILGAITGLLIYCVFSGNNVDWYSFGAILIGVLLGNLLGYLTKSKNK